MLNNNANSKKKSLNNVDNKKKGPKSYGDIHKTTAQQKVDDKQRQQHEKNRKLCRQKVNNISSNKKP